MNSGFRRLLLAGLLLAAVLPAFAFAKIHIGDVEVFWEDSLVVVRPEILSPFSEETRQTLRSGLPVAVDIDMQFIRTGYVKRLFKRVVVQYNVWTDRYRVLTPIGPLAVNDYPTVLALFRNDLVVPFPARELPGEGPWLVKVRAGERRVLRNEDGGGDAVDRIEEELTGIAGWLFRRGRPREGYSEWSPLKKLPPKGSARRPR